MTAVASSPLALRTLSMWIATKAARAGHQIGRNTLHDIRKAEGLPVRLRIAAQINLLSAVGVMPVEPPCDCEREPA